MEAGAADGASLGTTGSAATRRDPNETPSDIAGPLRKSPHRLVDCVRLPTRGKCKWRPYAKWVPSATAGTFREHGALANILI